MNHYARVLRELELYQDSIRDIGLSSMDKGQVIIISCNNLGSYYLDFAKEQITIFNMENENVAVLEFDPGIISVSYDAGCIYPFETIKSRINLL